MITVPATEFSKHFGHYREIVQQQAVAVTSHNRITGYFLSGAEYEKYLRAKQFIPQAFATSELSEETIRALAASQMGRQHDHLNALLDE